MRSYVPVALFLLLRSLLEFVITRSTYFGEGTSPVITLTSFSLDSVPIVGWLAISSGY